MTAAERQARRRHNLVDRRPLLELLIDPTEADEALAALRRADPPDANAIWHADFKRAQVTGCLAEALGVGPMWPVRQLRRRGWIAKGWLPPGS